MMKAPPVAPWAMPQPLLDSIRASDLGAEVSAAHLNDLRLSKRAGQIAAAMGRSPGSTLPDIMAADSELMAAYRFFNNEKVSPEALLEPHAQATAVRAASAERLLVITDTSEIRFTGEHREALGDVSGGEGFLGHVSLAVAEVGDVPVPLGVLSLQMLIRDHARKRRRKSSKAKPLFDKNNEFRRWPIAIQQSAATLHSPDKAIHVMDREGDSYAFLAWLSEHGHRFVVRLAHDRTVNAVGTSDKKAARPMSEIFAAISGVCERTVHVSAREAKGLRDADRKHPPRDERDATLSFAASRLRLRRPSGSKEELPDFVDVSVVRVWEESPPPGQKPIQWLLVTSEPIESADHVLDVVDIYRKRWIIEEYFKALKTGCAVEQRGFLTAHALQNVFALSLPVAWQLLAMRALSRLPVQVAASAVLSPAQLDVLHEATRKLPPSQRPPQNPNVSAALRAIAALGGHVTRNGSPGWLTLMKGFEKLRTLTDGYLIARRAPVEHGAGHGGALRDV